MPHSSLACALTLGCGACHKCGVDAHRRLELFLTSKNWTTADLARATGLAHSTISKIRGGHRSAGLMVALRIQQVTTEWADGPIGTNEWPKQIAPNAPVTDLRVEPGRTRAAHIDDVRAIPKKLPSKRGHRSRTRAA